MLQRHVVVEGEEARGQLAAHLETLWMRWMAMLSTTMDRAHVTMAAMRHWCVYATAALCCTPSAVLTKRTRGGGPTMRDCVPVRDAPQEGGGELVLVGQFEVHSRRGQHESSVVRR